MSDNATSRAVLCELADAMGVATEYWAYDGNRAAVDDQTLIKVLAALGVEAANEESARRAIDNAHLRTWREVVPTCTVVRDDRESRVSMHVPHGSDVAVEIVLEDGGSWILDQVEDSTPAREVDGVLTGQASFTVPAGLPLGYHTLRTRVSEGEGAGHVHDAPLIVVPQRLESPAERGIRGWGVMSQLYSVRSRDSWGIGDTSDLKEMCSLFGDLGGDFLLINPLHAAEPVGHITPSPYLPVTRRFFNPIYIRPEDIREVAYMPADTREAIAQISRRVKEMSLVNEIIDRDAVWDAKLRCLQMIFDFGRSEARQRDFERFRKAEGQGLEDFAFWSALREKYGEGFPEEIGGPSTPYADRERRELADRIDFFAWLQWIIDNQMAEAQSDAIESGMALGIFHDLAVGVHSQGSDVWSLGQAFATDVSVGAPPDMYNQQGQDWSQPPWRPDTLREMAYAPLRDTLRTVLRHAGGLRVDHIMGLFRLWWIPDGNPPSAGTYVRYDHEAMVGIVMLEAHRAGAVVVGEDLGNVEPWVRDFLAERGILGTSVLWFEQDWAGFRQPWDLRRETLVTVDTHDLPPVAGYLAGEHVDLRHRLGVLAEPLEKVRADAARERERMLGRLAEHGLVDEDSDEQEIIEAMHRYIAKSPGELLAIALVDAVGERRAQNQPGTNNEYPNWRVPLADGDGDVVLVEDLAGNARLRSLIDAFTAELRDSRT
ncbi:MAG: 4-alpha-glucanotransferase [Actinomycetaceae bacterium]|nr:4-alpha-glucanotransferase [Actinomycetaceae bacterium]